MRIQSNDIVILDTTDTKKIDLHITSNHPTVQIYDQNNSQEPLTPDLEKNPLILTPVIYIDSELITDDSNMTFTWTKIKGNEISEEDMGDSKILTISTNEDLDVYPTIRYKCKVEYNNKSFFNEITFARVNAGKDGASGNSAPAVKAQYSINGTSSWTATLNTSTHKYIRFSYDNGATWTSAIKIAGEDGKSVQIKGVAYAKTTPVTGQVIVLYSDINTSTQITNATNGDSYLVDGYLCVYNGTDFICTGQIQGPPGQKGDSYYLFIRYADNTNGGGISANPEGKSYIGFYRSSVNQVPTDVSSATWNWAKFVGEDAKSITLSANAQVFKIDKANTMTPATITVTAQTVNTSIPNSGWTYSIDGGRTFSATAPPEVSRSGNVVTLTGASMTQDSIVIKASDGTNSDFLTVYKVFDGSDGTPGGKGDSAPVAFLTNENISFAANAQGQVTGTTVYCNVVAYTGTTQVVPTVGTISSTDLPTGMSIGTVTTVSNQVRIPIVIANNATLGSSQNANGVINIPVTSPVSTTLQLTWSKINSGANGSDASLVDVAPSALYFKSNKGKDGTFTPEFIYLYPRFQNVTFGNWQYSIDGGVNWVAASGANGLTISTYNSIANTLRVAKTSTLYTDSVTSISFRCVSSNAAIYDTVSIAKIYDVVDLQVGGRNLLPNTSFDGGVNKIYNLPLSATTGEGGLTFNLAKPLSSGTEVAVQFQVRGSANINVYWLMTGGNVAQSVLSKSQISTTDFTTIERRYTIPDGKTLNSVFICTAYGNSTPGTDWFEIKTQTLKLEVGNTFTDWTPALEDIDANIVKVDKRITDSLVDIKTTTDGISSKVSDTEKSITTINGNISSITERVSEAEEKITSDAIVTTVRQSTEYLNDLGEKVGTNEIISKINQTAEAVTIEAKKIGLLGTTNIPDLTADKIKGGTLTLGGSSATTQNGQMIVKNASNTDVLKLNKDGIIVRSGHLAVAEDFTDQVFDWSNGNWLAVDRTRQLDLGDNFIRMGVYTNNNYTNYMSLYDDKLSFSGHREGIGLWGSSVGHDDYGYFTISDHVRGDIYIKGQDDVTLANLNNYGLYVNGPVYGGIARGNAKQLSNVFVEHFPGSHNGYIGIRLGTTTKYDNSMITIKGHVTAYQDSTSFEASCYYYYEQDNFYGAVATATNPSVLKEVYFAEEASTGYVFLLIGGIDSIWNYPTISIESISIGYNGHEAGEWNSEWWASIYPDLSSFTRVAPCARGGMSKVLWSGAVAAGSAITLDENLRNFKFLTCVIGSNTSPYGIVLGSFLDDSVSELHFLASTIITGTTVGKDFYVAKFSINDKKKITLTACASSTNSNAYVRKIVGWR